MSLKFESLLMYDPEKSVKNGENANIFKLLNSVLINDKTGKRISLIKAFQQINEKYKSAKNSSKHFNTIHKQVIEQNNIVIKNLQMKLSQAEEKLENLKFGQNLPKFSTDNQMQPENNTKVKEEKDKYIKIIKKLMKEREIIDQKFIELEETIKHQKTSSDSINSQNQLKIDEMEQSVANYKETNKQLQEENQSQKIYILKLTKNYESSINMIKSLKEKLNSQNDNEATRVNQMLQGYTYAFSELRKIENFVTLSESESNEIPKLLKKGISGYSQKLTDNDKKQTIKAIQSYEKQNENLRYLSTNLRKLKAFLKNKTNYFQGEKLVGEDVKIQLEKLQKEQKTTKDELDRKKEELKCLREVMAKKNEEFQTSSADLSLKYNNVLKSLSEMNKKLSEYRKYKKLMVQCENCENEQNIFIEPNQNQYICANCKKINIFQKSLSKNLENEKEKPISNPISKSTEKNLPNKQKTTKKSKKVSKINKVIKKIQKNNKKIPKNKSKNTQNNSKNDQKTKNKQKKSKNENPFKIPSEIPSDISNGQNESRPFVKIENVQIYSEKYRRHAYKNYSPFPMKEFRNLYNRLLKSRQIEDQRFTRSGNVYGIGKHKNLVINHLKYPILRKKLDALLENKGKNKIAILMYLRVFALWLTNVTNDPKPWIKPAPISPLEHFDLVNEFKNVLIEDLTDDNNNNNNNQMLTIIKTEKK